VSRKTIGVLAISAWLTIGRAQMPSVHGEIANASGMGSDMAVFLLDPSTPQSPHRGTLSDSGSFEFDGVSPGGYILRLVRLPDQTISEQYVQIQMGAFLSLRLPERKDPPPAQTVSVDQLRNPLTRKAAAMLRKAQDLSHEGDHEKALAQLRIALREPSAIPYARSIMGVEYLRLRNPAAALSELEEAVRLLPHDAVDHANLAYTLFLLGQKERAQQEVDRALELDPQNSHAQYLKGVMLGGN
jgi:tetratricopeptide (TPR) repeat protein